MYAHLLTIIPRIYKSGDCLSITSLRPARSGICIASIPTLPSGSNFCLQKLISGDALTR